MKDINRLYKKNSRDQSMVQWSDDMYIRFFWLPFVPGKVSYGPISWFWSKKKSFNYNLNENKEDIMQFDLRTFADYDSYSPYVGVFIYSMVIILIILVYNMMKNIYRFFHTKKRLRAFKSTLDIAIWYHKEPPGR